MPIDCRFATWLLSDIPSAAWAGAGILALVAGRRAAGNGGKAFAGLLAALCFGLSWLTRTQVAQLAPFVLGALVIWSWRDRKNLWLAVPAAAGVLAIFLIEGFCYLSATGDFLYPLHSAERVYVMHSQWYYFTEGGVYGWAPGHYALGLARRLLWKGPAGLLLNADFALVPLAALAAAAHALYWRRREFLFPAALFLWSALVFNFGSASLKHYEPLPWVSSYMVPCLLPAAAVTGGWLAWLISSREENARVRRERRFWAALICAGIALAAAFGLYQDARQGSRLPGHATGGEIRPAGFGPPAVFGRDDAARPGVLLGLPRDTPDAGLRPDERAGDSRRRRSADQPARDPAHARPGRLRTAAVGRRPAAASGPSSSSGMARRSIPCGGEPQAGGDLAPS